MDQGEQDTIGKLSIYARLKGIILSSAATSSSDRPPIPTRPADDPNRAPSDDENDFHNEDLGEEAPQVVVLKEGRHMTAEEAELAKQSKLLAGSDRDTS